MIYFYFFLFNLAFSTLIFVRHDEVLHQKHFMISNKISKKNEELKHEVFSGIFS